MSRTNCAIGTGYVIASFKGVPFMSTECDVEGGRRGAEGEFPFGENTAYADLGRKIRVYHITAVFREDSHIADAQTLFEVCQSSGPGVLVHPTRGTLTAACRSVKVKDNSEEQGETTAELEFVEANTAATGLLGSIFGVVATALNAVSQTSFLANYQPQLVAQPWRTDVIDTAQTLVGIVARTTQQTTPADAPAQQHRNILQMHTVAQDDGIALRGENVNRALAYGFNTIATNVTDVPTRYTVMRRLANAAAKTSTLPQGAAADSEDAVLQRFRILAGVGMAEAAMARRYPTVNDALTTMDQVAAVLDDEAKTAYDDCANELFLEIRKYETQFKTMMNDIAYRLPPLIVVNFGGGVHPLVAAYAIYKDAKRHRELEQRDVLDANGRFGPVIVAVAPQ